MRHFRQIANSKRFQAYDYGEAKNRQVYGSPRPIDFGRNYDKIDIPIHFLLGLQDTLIEPINIIRQFSMLSDKHPQLAYLQSFSSSAHLDFTLGLDEEMIIYILKALRQTARTPQRENRKQE